MRITLHRERDGRWIADLVELPGVMAYGGSRHDATRNVQILALRVLADRIENNEPVPDVSRLFQKRGRV